MLMSYSWPSRNVFKGVSEQTYTNSFLLLQTGMSLGKHLEKFSKSPSL
jgi:hypothetical protein